MTNVDMFAVLLLLLVSLTIQPLLLSFWERESERKGRKATERREHFHDLH